MSEWLSHGLFFFILLSVYSVVSVEIRRYGNTLPMALCRVVCLVGMILVSFRAMTGGL